VIATAKLSCFSPRAERSPEDGHAAATKAGRSDDPVGASKAFAATSMGWIAGATGDGIGLASGPGPQEVGCVRSLGSALSAAGPMHHRRVRFAASLSRSIRIVKKSVPVTPTRSRRDRARDGSAPAIRRRWRASSSSKIGAVPRWVPIHRLIWRDYYAQQKTARRSSRSRRQPFRRSAYLSDRQNAPRLATLRRSDPWGPLIE